MKPLQIYVRTLISGVLAVLAAAAIADEVPLNKETITFWSDGARLRGDVFKPGNLETDQRLPGILMIHGWGGHRGNLNKSFAPQMARLGFVVMTFDMRSWGESDGYFVAADSLPVADEVSDVNVSGQHLRSIVNPIKMIEDARAALAWFVAEPQLQADNIGVWGTSFGGGLALVTAAGDSRVKALVTQMGTVDNKANFAMIPEGMVTTWETKRARGEITPYPGPESASPGLRGYPDLIAMKRFDPRAFWDQLIVPTLVIDAEDEELFDRTLNGQALYESLRGRVETRYEVIPGKHYELYSGEGYARALEAAQKWFVTHLK